MHRRTLIQMLAAALLPGGRVAFASEPATDSQPTTLRDAPIELVGPWGGSPVNDAAAVISRMREVSLAGVKLLSDDQPDRIRVEDHSSGPPAIWLHDDHSRTAVIIVDAGDLAWCQLDYQFGHELGHVLCNSWDANAKPAPPSQWLEESLVEAFSLRGLGLLATSWEQNPPFPHNSAYSAAIRDYRANVARKHREPGDPPDQTNLADWFRTSRPKLEGGKVKWGGPAILAALALLEADRACVEDLGALNRWPERTALPIEDYLARWQSSCAEIGTAGHLPMQLKSLFGLA
jgi:hypothetical protein